MYTSARCKGCFVIFSSLIMLIEWLPLLQPKERNRLFRSGIIGRMRTPVREAFSYGIRHGIRHIHCDSMKYDIMLHWITMNMPYSVWKCLPYGSTHPPYWWLQTSVTSAQRLPFYYRVILYLCFYKYKCEVTSWLTDLALFRQLYPGVSVFLWT